jgi:medium-chain acyl-[acyl-carrier-protein] hydrolase
MGCQSAKSSRLAGRTQEWVQIGMPRLHCRSVDRHETAQFAQQNGDTYECTQGFGYSFEWKPQESDGHWLVNPDEVESSEVDEVVSHTDAETKPTLISAMQFDPWIVSRKPSPQARMRLFCFPYAGGPASVFRNWSDGLPTDIEVCPVQFPGRGTRLTEPPFSQLPLLIGALTKALLPFLDRPFALFGHSLGSLVSFELARQLRTLYQMRPVRLFVSAGPAPQIPHRSLPIHNLPDSRFSAELRRLNGTPEELLSHRELMDIVLPSLRADFALYENYRYLSETPLNCPISAYGGLSDERVRSGDLEAWREQSSVSFSIRMFPGDHFFLKTAQPLLLRALSQELR